MLKHMLGPKGREHAERASRELCLHTRGSLQGISTEHTVYSQLNHSPRLWSCCQLHQEISTLLRYTDGKLSQPHLSQQKDADVSKGFDPICLLWIVPKYINFLSLSSWSLTDEHLATLPNTAICLFLLGVSNVTLAMHKQQNPGRASKINI